LTQAQRREAADREEKRARAPSPDLGVFEARKIESRTALTD
jgi:hypothetical protein